MSDSSEIQKDIAEDGAKWNFHQRVSATSAKAWQPSAQTETVIEVDAIKVLATSYSQYFARGEMPEEIFNLLVPVFAAEPNLNDAFEKDGVFYNIKKIAKIKPADETLIYRIMVYR